MKKPKQQKAPPAEVVTEVQPPTKHIANEVPHVAGVVVPKPTKKEVIAALLIKAEADHYAKMKFVAEERTRTEQEYREALQEFATPENFRVRVVRNMDQRISSWLPVNFNIQLNELPPEIEEKRKAYEQAANIRTYEFNAADARREIVDALTNHTERVEALAESEQLKTLWEEVKGKIAGVKQLGAPVVDIDPED
jgi:hypothetical protein